MKVIVIGIGLIGGSFALAMKEKYKKAFVVGVDSSKMHLQKALELGLIDEMGEIEDVQEADLVIIAVPVDATVHVLKKVLDTISHKTIVLDTGSTKQFICESVAMHPKRGNYVASHPIAGTEFSGPTAADSGLFQNKINTLCEVEKTNPQILSEAKKLLLDLGMKLVYMDHITHDKHIAYCSHLSHACSFMLGKTVIQKEKNEQGILDLAGSGFASTVRLAKSSPAMWTPIFMENKENIVEALDGFISNLIEFREIILSGDHEKLFGEMKNVNRIKTILKDIDSKKPENNTNSKSLVYG